MTCCINCAVYLVPSILVIFFVPICQVSSLVTKEFFDRCLDGQHHKQKPGPEDSLHEQCTPWANRSCCTKETSVDVHTKNMYNFDWDHCQAKKSMSEECKKHFIQDQCFYECSPNIGPWLVKVEQKIRNEKFFGVPICASDCDRWFDTCKNDFTCTNNWGRNFEWVEENGKKVNKCPAESQCQTFKNVFRTAKDFCEQLWDYSWKYTPDNEPCMRMWFDGTNGNPNDDVLLWKIRQLTGSAAVEVKLWKYILPVLTSVWWAFWQLSQ